MLTCLSSYIAESTAELNEQKTKLAELQKKLAELNAQQDQNLAAVAIAKKECAQQKGFTKAQVYHLQSKPSVTVDLPGLTQPRRIRHTPTFTCDNARQSHVQRACPMFL